MMHGQRSIKIQEIVWDSVSQTFILADPFWLRKITTDSHILAYVNMDCMDDRYPKLDIYTSELISDSREYTPLTYVTINRKIWA
jgi:hypothetical protein